MYNVITISRKSKLAKQLINKYHATRFRTLFDAYSNPSPCKQDIYRDLEEYRLSIGGEFRVIPTRNTSVFTYAFTNKFEDRSIMHYFTPTTHYIID